jgi:hypothetical protein
MSDTPLILSIELLKKILILRPWQNCKAKKVKSAEREAENVRVGNY